MRPVNPDMPMNRMNKRFLSPGGVLLSGFFLIILAGSSLASDETVSPDSWIYPALRTFELLGLVRLEPTIPYSRRQVEFYMDRILSSLKDKEDELSPRQQFVLGRLREEFQGLGAKPGDREDQPVYFLREGNRYFALDFTSGGAFRKRAGGEKVRGEGLLIPGVLVDLGGRITVETTYRVRIEPERDLNVGGRKPSYRLKSFRGVTSEFEKGYLSFRGTRWKVLIGRDYVHWGSGREEGLLLSRSAGSLDQVRASFSIGRFTLSAVHALLDPGYPRRLAGHRLTIRLPRGIYLGIGETVLYTGRDFDFTYLTPVSAFYSNQYGERGDDNILWGLDWKIPVRRRLILYGEVLVDDFQYESDPPAPNRLAVNLTAESLVMLGKSEVELLAAYTFIDIFTYAHKDYILTRYVTGDGDPSMNRIIGSPLGPDADRWDFGAAAPVHPRVVISARGSITRRGESNNLREWDRKEDPNPPFPSGDVTRENIVSLGGVVDLGRGSSLSAGGGWMNMSSSEEDISEGFGYLELIWDF